MVNEIVRQVTESLTPHIKGKPPKVLWAVMKSITDRLVVEKGDGEGVECVVDAEGE